MTRVGLVVAIALAGLAPAPALAAPAPSLFLGPPRLSEDGARLEFLVAPTRSAPGRLPLGDLEVLLDGSTAAVKDEPHAEYARRMTRSDPAWKPRLAVGLVFFWGQRAPQDLMNGLPELFRKFPANTTVYPVPYGQGHPSFVNPRAAADLTGGELDNLGFIQGEHPTLALALQFTQQQVLKHEQGARFLIVVTDGRDAQRGADPAGFEQLGQQLRADGMMVQVVSFPAAVEQAEARANVEALARGAGGPHLVAGSIAELTGAIEAASLAYLDSWQVGVELPFLLKGMGGQPRLTVRARVDGQPVSSERVVFVPAGGLRWWLVAGLLTLTITVAGGLWLLSMRRTGAGEALLDELQRQIRLGAPAQRIVLDLSRKFPQEVHRIARLDASRLGSGEYGVLKSEAGRALLLQVQQALEPDGEEQGSADLAGELAQAVTTGADPADAATRMRACLPDSVCGTFARTSFRDLLALLKQAAPRHPELATAAARQLVLAIQDKLRARTGEGVAVGWLVRAGGPGRRGETLPLEGETTLIGRDSKCSLSVSQDAQLAPQHATVVASEGVFVIRPVEGQVLVEGEIVEGEHRLADGETVELGAGAYVFKSVVAD